VERDGALLWGWNIRAAPFLRACGRGYGQRIVRRIFCKTIISQRSSKKSAYAHRSIRVDVSSNYISEALVDVVDVERRDLHRQRVWISAFRP
jgi:hypothetical protein